jgi:hypothetical protein
LSCDGGHVLWIDLGCGRKAVGVGADSEGHAVGTFK